MLFASCGYSAQDNNFAFCNQCERECDACECPTPCPPPPCPPPPCEPCCTPCEVECCECVPKPSCPMPCECAFNAPCRVGTCWDFFATGSFIYWQAMEDGTDVGYAPTFNSDGIQTGLQLKQMDFDFKPGFKVGIGMNTDWDNWEVYAEYTWLHLTNSRSFSVSDGTAIPTSGEVNIAPWVPTANGFPSSSLDVASISGTSMKGRWQLKLDVVDLELARCYYVGQRLTFRTHYGLRGAFIRQHYNATLSTVNSLGGEFPAPVTSFNQSHNWGVGARGGVDTHWMFCSGFYLFGNAAASLLYTQFGDDDDVKVNYTQNTTTAFGVSETGTVNIESGRRMLGPEFDMALGFGWADYIDCGNKWYLDLSAGYEFTTFFNQNAFRNFYSVNVSDTNLYFHGLTVTVRLDF